MQTSLETLSSFGIDWLKTLQVKSNIRYYAQNTRLVCNPQIVRGEIK